MDLLAAKAAALFPEVERTQSWKQRQQQRQQESEKLAGESALTPQRPQSPRKTTTPVPCCHQYIYDRVSGHSYVPRGGPLRRQHEPSCSSLTGSQQQEDPTDSRNRPPHYLCFVPPCVRRCPGFFEQNWICEHMGRIGFHRYFKNHHLARRRIFFIGFCFNWFALILTLWACFAFSIQYDILRFASFMRGRVHAPALLGDSTLLTMDLGFRAVAWQDPFHIFNDASRTHDVETFIHFCETDLAEDLGSSIEAQFCGSCQDSSYSFFLSSLINVILILRNMFSDITRMYPKYDLNCPNFNGSLMATLSVCLGVYTIFSYQDNCGDNFKHVLTPEFLLNHTNLLPNQTNDDAFQLPDELQPLDLEFTWQNGPGLTCLFVATFLKLVDAICNFIVPTPSITRTRREQEEYELQYPRISAGGVHQLSAAEHDDDVEEYKEENEGLPKNAIEKPHHEGVDSQVHEDAPEDEFYSVSTIMPNNNHSI